MKSRAGHGGAIVSRNVAEGPSRQRLRRPPENGHALRLERRRHDLCKDPRAEVLVMLHYAVVFFIIAIIAAVFGFGGIASGAAGIAKVLFVVFLVVAGVSLLLGRRNAI
jgi:uncharacterized membrane protein YtjA (UPF0391 family)